MQILKGDKLLSKSQCEILRGIAIIGIFLHNFCHLLPGSNEENEFTFNVTRAQNMWNYWAGGNIDAYFPIQLFSFFGHYGVPIFFFLSGFGLVRKYEQDCRLPHSSAIHFLGHHWLKLFKLMFLGFVLTIITYQLCGLSWHGWLEYFAQATMLSNLIPSISGSQTPSPYWFFGVMIEIYVIYRILIYPFHDKHQSKWRWLIPLLLVVLAWLLQVFMQQHGRMLSYMRLNAAIAMLPFAIGVLTARYGFPKLSRWTLGVVALIALPLLACFSLNYQTWLWTPIIVLMGSIAFVKFIEPCQGLCSTVIKSPLRMMGALSAMIFVVHSIPRMPIYIFAIKGHSGLLPVDYAWLAIYIAATLLLAWLYKWILQKMNVNNDKKTGGS